MVYLYLSKGRRENKEERRVAESKNFIFQKISYLLCNKKLRRGGCNEKEEKKKTSEIQK